jgi:hypothetical protein
MASDLIRAPAAIPQQHPPAMSMERIDFLLARAEATLRAAAAALEPTPASPAPAFSRVADPTVDAGVDIPAAAAPRAGSRGGYAGEMRRMADAGRAVSEVLEARPGKKKKGRSLSPSLVFPHVPS